MNRAQLIQDYIDKHNYQSYLEIGIGTGEVHKSINILKKVGVDIFVELNDIVKMSSDDFFSINKDKFDIIFIDGDHSEEQSWKDFENSIKVLNDGGTIMMHDIDQLENPLGRGDVYKTWERIVNSNLYNTAKVFVPQDNDYMGIVKFKL